jgi:hypothetical protein
MQYRRSQAFITELETSARSESKRMTNHNNPQLSQMDLANHCAAFAGLSLLNTRAVLIRFWARNVKGSCLSDDLGLDGRMNKLDLKLIRSELDWICLANSRLLLEMKRLALQKAD